MLSVLHYFKVVPFLPRYKECPLRFNNIINNLPPDSKIFDDALIEYFSSRIHNCVPQKLVPDYLVSRRLTRTPGKLFPRCEFEKNVAAAYGDYRKATE